MVRTCCDLSGWYVPKSGCISWNYCILPHSKWQFSIYISAEYPIISSLLLNFSFVHLYGNEVVFFQLVLKVLRPIKLKSPWQSWRRWVFSFILFFAKSIVEANITKYRKSFVCKVADTLVEPALVHLFESKWWTSLVQAISDALWSAVSWVFASAKIHNLNLKSVNY